MGITDAIVNNDHEQVFFYRDRSLGLLAIIAIHNTVLGPSLGGCRMRAYESVDAALNDVLRLAEGMTYKHALCGNNLGGGKGVIVRDSHFTEGRSDVFKAFGNAVESLEGRYITAEDMGTCVDDMEIVRKVTQHVAGFDLKSGGGGDPSPWTALGVYQGIRACLEYKFGSDSLEGRHVALQGIGHVGLHLATMLAEAGAQLTITDTHVSSLEESASKLGAQVVDPQNIYSVPCDVFAPCAVGSIISADTVPRLACKIIAGAANNQILGDNTEQALMDRGILYAPDFLLNAGGAILCASEQEEGGYSEAWVRERVEGIYQTTGQILDQSQAGKGTPCEVAIGIAKERIANASKES